MNDKQQAAKKRALDEYKANYSPTIEECIGFDFGFDAGIAARDAEVTKLQAKLKKAMDYINDLADNGFEKARAVRDEIEGMK